MSRLYSWLCSSTDPDASGVASLASQLSQASERLTHLFGLAQRSERRLEPSRRRPLSGSLELLARRSLRHLLVEHLGAGSGTSHEDQATGPA